MYIEKRGGLGPSHTYYQMKEEWMLKSEIKPGEYKPRSENVEKGVVKCVECFRLDEDR